MHGADKNHKPLYRFMMLGETRTPMEVTLALRKEYLGYLEEATDHQHRNNLQKSIDHLDAIIELLKTN